MKNFFATLAALVIFVVLAPSTVLAYTLPHSVVNPTTPADLNCAAGDYIMATPNPSFSADNLTYLNGSKYLENSCGTTTSGLSWNDWIGITLNNSHWDFGLLHDAEHTACGVSFYDCTFYATTSVFFSKALFVSPANTASTISSFLTGTLQDAGLLLVLAAMLALPMVFWIIEQIKALFPKPYHDERGARRHYARRAYLDDTDDRSSRGDYLHKGE